MRRVAFSIPPALESRVDAVISAIREDSTPRAHAEELADVIVEMTHIGLGAYFLAPLERVDVGTLAYGTAKMGVKAAGKGLPTIVRRVIGGMTDEQLEELVEIMDKMMV